jgi:SAM-dependent methyltransferase
VETAGVLAEDPALRAYEGIAPFYDELTAAYDYETWLNRLEALALEHGLRGRRLLDVACGTGKSFLPMVRRGYEVTACDLSPAMVALAREKAPPGSAEVLVADMRELPRLGEFDLVTCLDDSLNYLLEGAEMAAAIRGMAANLAPGGLLVFDLNTLGTYERVFCRDSVSEANGTLFCWRGDRQAERAPGERFGATIEVFSHEYGDLWARLPTLHSQRHHPRQEVERALDLAGLELLAVRGQAVGARLEGEPDEERHQKLVYLAGREVNASGRAAITNGTRGGWRRPAPPVQPGKISNSRSVQ